MQNSVSVSLKRPPIGVRRFRVFAPARFHTVKGIRRQQNGFALLVVRQRIRTLVGTHHRQFTAAVGDFGGERPSPRLS